MSTTVRVDPEVGTIVFRARLILAGQQPGRNVTMNQAVRTLLAVNNLHRVGLASPPVEPDPVDPPCQGAS